MFGPITVPFGAKMLFNTVTLKPGVTLRRWKWWLENCVLWSKSPTEGRKADSSPDKCSSSPASRQPRVRSQHPAPPTTTMSSSPIGARSTRTSAPMRTTSSRRSSQNWRPCVPRPKSWGMTCCGKERREATNRTGSLCSSHIVPECSPNGDQR